MGYRGKVVERQRARELRARSWTLTGIADELGVSKGSVSVWVRDVGFVARPRNRGHPAGPEHPMRLTDGSVIFANSDPLLVGIFLRWLRSEFDIDESRLRVRLYLHADLDADAATEHWSQVTDVPRSQFHKPYRAAVDETMRRNRHQYGCAGVVYSSVWVHRRVMALIAAVGSALAGPG